MSEALVTTAAVAPLDIALRLAGLFYCISSLLAMRRMAGWYLIERALIAISPTASALQAQAAHGRMLWWLCNLMLTSASGLCLLLGSEAAWPLCVLGALGQAVYLYVLAPRYLDPQDPPDADDLAGRRQSRNAFFAYLLLTLVLGWALISGHWPAADTLASRHPWLLWLGAAGIVIHGVRLLRQIQTPGQPAGAAAPVSASEPLRVLVMAEYDCSPLWRKNQDDDTQIALDTLGLSPELEAAFRQWAQEYDDSISYSSPLVWTDDDKAAHNARGLTLAHQLLAELTARYAQQDVTVEVYHQGLDLVQWRVEGDQGA